MRVSDSGELVLPGELVRAAPQSRLRAERQGETLVIGPFIPDTPGKNSDQLSEDMVTFWEAFPSFAHGTVDPSMTFRREDIYGDDGR